MALVELETDPSPRELRLFGLLLLGFAALVGGLVWWRTGQVELAAWVGGGVGALALVYLAVPPLRRFIYLGWIYLTFPIGWTISALLLAVTYYGVVTPVGMVMRLVGRDPLQRRRSPERESYWERRSAGRPRSSYFRQF
jgi:hypothetical protein